MANVIIAAQLFSSLAKLSAKEQARVIDFIKTFQSNPANPGVSLERLTRTRSRQVWSGRISRDLRAILHKDGDTWAILYADHHDAAYDWAERRDVGRHSVTGALQIVESIETVREVERVVEVHVAQQAAPLFAAHEDTYLVSLGLPETWLPTLRSVRDDDQLLTVCERLPDDVAERLLALASGEFVTPPTPVASDRPSVEAADTRRRFYFVDDPGGLAAALEAPMERWIAFLHPSQLSLVERSFSGPAKVSGSAGTGKTVVAMHRARHLARLGHRVLLTSFVSTLCDNIERNMEKLCSARERDRIRVSTVHKQALAIVSQAEPRVRPASNDDVRRVLDEFRMRHAPGYERQFVQAEWESVVRMQGIATWDEYRSARRTGRGRGLGVRQRKELWRVFGGTLEALAKRSLLDWPGLCRRAEELLSDGHASSPYDAVIVDEVQDLKPPELRFLKALCATHPGNFMVCGDAGQRIYPGGFSLRALGIEVRGRAKVLRINYRTTEQIRRVADRVLGQACDDMDGGTETREGTRSLLSGPTPRLAGYPTTTAENDAALSQIHRWLAGGLDADAIGVFARTAKRATALTEMPAANGIDWHRLSDRDDPDKRGVRLGTMHRAKGLEFKAVLVLGCSDKELPSPYALRDIEDPQDREAAVARERRLLYVAMTRARDELTVSWVSRPTRFLDQLLDAEGGKRA